MKWLLIVYVCSMANGKCDSSQIITGYQFNNHYDCVVAGYKYSYNKFVNLEKDEELEREFIESKKMAVKFECKGLPAFGT